MELSRVAKSLVEARTNTAKPPDELKALAVAAARCLKAFEFLEDSDRYISDQINVEEPTKAVQIADGYLDAFQDDEHKAGAEQSELIQLAINGFDATSSYIDRVVADQNLWLSQQLDDSKNPGKLDTALVNIPEVKRWWLGSFGEETDIPWERFWYEFSGYMGFVYGFPMNDDSNEDIQLGIKTCMGKVKYNAIGEWEHDDDIQIKADDFKLLYQRFGPWNKIYYKCLTLCDVNGSPCDIFYPTSERSTGVMYLKRNKEKIKYVVRYSARPGKLVHQTLASNILITNAISGYIVDTQDGDPQRKLSDVAVALRKCWDISEDMLTSAESWRMLLDRLDQSKEAAGGVSGYHDLVADSPGNSDLDQSVDDLDVDQPGVLLPRDDPDLDQPEDNPDPVQFEDDVAAYDQIGDVLEDEMLDVGGADVDPPPDIGADVDPLPDIGGGGVDPPPDIGVDVDPPLDIGGAVMVDVDPPPDGADIIVDADPPPDPDAGVVEPRENGGDAEVGLDSGHHDLSPPPEDISTADMMKKMEEIKKRMKNLADEGASVIESKVKIFNSLGATMPRLFYIIPDDYDASDSSLKPNPKKWHLHALCEGNEKIRSGNVDYSKCHETENNQDVHDLTISEGAFHDYLPIILRGTQISDVFLGASRNDMEVDDQKYDTQLGDYLRKLEQFCKTHLKEEQLDDAQIQNSYKSLLKLFMQSEENILDLLHGEFGGLKLMWDRQDERPVWVCGLHRENLSSLDAQQQLNYQLQPADVLGPQFKEKAVAEKIPDVEIDEQKHDGDREPADDGEPTDDREPVHEKEPEGDREPLDAKADVAFDEEKQEGLELFEANLTVKCVSLEGAAISGRFVRPYVRIIPHDTKGRELEPRETSAKMFEEPRWDQVFVWHGSKHLIDRVEFMIYDRYIYWKDRYLGVCTVKMSGKYDKNRKFSTNIPLEVDDELGPLHVEVECATTWKMK